MQAWGEWMDTLDMAVVMAYPATVARLQYILAKSAAIDKSKIGVGLSGLNFDVTPNARIAPAILVDCVNWARSAGYTNFAWFDYTKIDAEQYAVVAQLAPQSEGGIMSAITDLTAIAADLEAKAAALRQQATDLEAKAAQIRAISDSLVAADKLADDLAAAL